MLLQEKDKHRMMFHQAKEKMGRFSLIILTLRYLLHGKLDVYKLSEAFHESRVSFQSCKNTLK